jgi:phosphoserine phosphatase
VTTLQHQELWRILEVTRQLGAPISLEEILTQVVDAAREVLQADRGTVFLHDEARGELYSRVATGEEEIRFPTDRGIAGETAQTRTTVNVPDCYADSRFNPEIDKKTGYRTRSLLSVPLVGIDGKLVGVLQVLNKHSGHFTEDDEYLAGTLAAQCAVALQRAMLIDEYLIKQKLQSDLELARDVQMRFLPKYSPEIPGYELAGWSEPADETGGDLYDMVQVSDQRVALMLADATGHGIGPALSVSQVRAMFRMGIRVGSDFETLFSEINKQLSEDLPGNRFVTAFLGLLDSGSNQIIYQSGGQGPLMHFQAAKNDCEWLDASTVPMGILPGLKSPLPDPVRMRRGDILGLISDGIFEYDDRREEQFGTERVASLVRQHRDKSPARLIELIRQAIRDFAGDAPQDDDMTIVFIKRSV